MKITFNQKAWRLLSFGSVVSLSQFGMAQAAPAAKLAKLPTPAKKPVAAPAPPLKADIVGDVDGNVLTVMIKGVPTQVQLYGVSVPSEAEATKIPTSPDVKLSFLGNAATLYPKGKDPSGRMLVWVFAGKVGVNGELIKAGLARWDQKAAPTEVKLAEFEKQAKAQGLGIWTRPGTKVAPYAVPKQGPDLIISKVTFEPDHIVTGQLFQPKVYIKNIGTTPAEAFYVFQEKGDASPAGFGGQFTVAPGEEKLWLTGGITAPAAGTYKIKYFADAKNKVKESNKKNNSYEATVVIHPN